MAYYLDLFLGDPAAGGTSVLQVITGSATRIDVTDDLEESVSYEALLNPDVVTVTAAALAGSNVSHVALYDAASGGTLLKSRRIGAHITVMQGNPVRFLGLNLKFPVHAAVTISLSATLASTETLTADLTVSSIAGQWDFSLAIQSGEILTCGI